MLNNFSSMIEMSYHHPVSLQTPLLDVQIFHMPWMCHQQ